MPWEEAGGRHQVGCWRPEPPKQKIRRHREGSENKRVVSKEVGLWRLASMGCMASRGLLTAAGAVFVGITCYMCEHQQPSRGPIEASHPVETCYLLATGWHRGGLQREPPEDLWRFASSKLTPCSSDPPLCLLIFCSTGSGFQQPN